MVYTYIFENISDILLTLKSKIKLKILRAIKIIAIIGFLI